MDDSHRLDFSDVIASTIHDTKNTLGMIFNTLEEMTSRCQQRGCQHHEGLFLLQYEIKRLNNSLIRLLALYKSQKAPININMNFHPLRDCLEEVIAQNEPILVSRGIIVELECPSHLFWAFDKGLVIGVLDNVLNNAYRYTKDRIKMTAIQRGSYLLITIADNGKGYPDDFLVDGSNPDGMAQPVSFLTGNTGLGIYFSTLVAKAHRRNILEGYIKVANEGPLGGGMFALYLP